MGQNKLKIMYLLDQLAARLIKLLLLTSIMTVLLCFDVYFCQINLC